MHIAFVAMSGVRAWNPEITAAGLTMPGFLERSQTIASLPSLGLLTLAGMTPDEFTVSYHEVLDIHDAGRAARLRRRRHLVLLGPDQGGLRAGRPLPGGRRQGRPRRAST